MSAETGSGRSASVDPIFTVPTGRAGLARRTLVRVTLAAGLTVVGVGVLATGASAAAPTATSGAPSAPALSDTTEPGEGPVGEPVVVTIIPPSPAEPATTVPPPIIRAEAIVRPAAGQVGTPQAHAQSYAPRAEAQASTKALPRLPETGSATGPLVVAGAGLIGLGAVALACGRRVRTA